MTLGEKLFVGIPACIVLLIVVDATWNWSLMKWMNVCYQFTSGYLMWIIWENRHNFRRPHNG